jgi:hypothetical protein
MQLEGLPLTKALIEEIQLFMAHAERQIDQLNNHRLKPVGLSNGLKVRIRVD